MITAVDTNVLLDVFSADPTHGEASRGAIARCIREGRLIASDVVWAEVTAAFPSIEQVRHGLEALGVAYAPPGVKAATTAGTAWQKYRRAGGPRTRVIADFLVGAHALCEADRLLTRDRGFYRAYFAGLTVLDPSEG